MKNGQFHNTLTVRNLLRVFMGSTSTSTIDQGSKAILGTSSQENKILTDCSADYIARRSRNQIVLVLRLRQDFGGQVVVVLE